MVTHLCLTEIEKSWLASAIDFEGCLGLYSSPRKGSGQWSPTLQIGVCNKELVEELCKLCQTNGYYSYQPKNNNHREVFRFVLRPNKLRWLLPQILPYLIIKQKQAELLLEALKILKDKGGKGERIGLISQKIKILNQRGRNG